MNGERQNRLLTMSDLDPERWKPLYYPLTVNVPVAENGQVVGSIVLNNKPYIITRIATTILGNTLDPETSGLYNDGQYLISLKEEQIQYTSQPIMADMLFGPKVEGAYRLLDFPIYLAGTHTLEFTVINTYTRVLTPVAETFQVQILVGGLCDWGKIESNR